MQELTNETMRAETELWNGVRKFCDIGLPRENIQPPEITFLALALMTYSLFRWGQRGKNIPAAADRVTLNILTERLKSDKSALPEVLDVYRARHTEYARALPKLFDSKTPESEQFSIGIAMARHITDQDRSALVGTYLTGAGAGIVSRFREVIEAA